MSLRSKTTLDDFRKDIEMNNRTTTILLAVVLLLVASIPTTQAASLNQSYASVNPSVAGSAPAGSYDFTTHGTAWVREKPSKFKTFKYYGWGTVAKVKAAGVGDQWVHIAVPFPSRMANSLMNIKYVEFCAQSTNGASTKPTRMDLWDYTGRFLSKSISWPADNSAHCFGYTYSSPSFHQDLGISVLLHFANTTDKITLDKAWVRVTP
jgi:hypothetical protein